MLGFAFKKDTGDVRETPALMVCDMLMKDGALVHVYDPKVLIEVWHLELLYTYLPGTKLAQAPQNQWLEYEFQFGKAFFRN